jgi:thermitase
MHKNRWRYLKVTIAIIILFLANTVYVAFNPMLLREVEAKEDSSADKNSTFYPAQSSNDFYFNSQDKNKRMPKSFQNFWGFDAFNRDSSFNGIKGYGDFAIADGDSMELVIGVNPEAYHSLVKAINASQGKVVNTISIRGEVIAIVADMPFNVVSSFRGEVQTKNLARYVEPNMKFKAQFVPNDPYWSLQWGPQKIEADWAWNTTTGSHSVIVAVIDSGIDYTHPDLAANYVTGGRDWVNDDEDPLDDFGHGTHCAGIIAAVLNNAVGIAGIANVSIMAEKGLDAYGSGWEDDLANAIIHAVDQGADILSNSWGGYGESYLIHDAVQYAYNHSVLVVAAAGNDAWSRKSIPAAYDEVVAVTATDSYDAPASFTNFGDWVEVAAPGVDIYSTMPTYHVTLNDYGYSMNYDYMSGTSMACPHAAGVAALIWSQFPNATRDWVRAQLRYTGDDLGDPGFDEYYGYGRINARKAVEQAPPEHDLLIFDWNRPQYVKLGELATFNITVLNFGVNNETNVEVHLLVNDSLVDSTSISPLPGGTSRTVSLSWTPTTVGTHNVTYYVVPAPDETIIQNNQISEILYVITPPSETNWMLLETDPDEGIGTNLKSIYGQVCSNIIYFKVEYHRNWTTINDIDTAIFIDADQNVDTGLPDRTYPGQDTGIGADYLIIVGWEATEMWKWDPITEMWDISNPISLAYLEVPENSNVFVVGVFFADVETSGIVDCAVVDVMSNWDWMPDSGYFTWILIRYEHELAVLLKTPRYLQPGETALVNATVCNWGLNNETDVEIQVLINGTQVASETLDELVNGTSYTIEYLWTPTVEATYNVTAYAPPVPGEEVTANNQRGTLVEVFKMVIAVVLDSLGTDYGYYAFWDYLNTNWATYGTMRIVIDYTSLNKENITLADIEATHADVLIISDAWSDTYDYGWEFSDSEIEAIKTYVLSGHGIIATSGTFDTWTAPNNQKLAELFGMDPTVWYNCGFDGEQKDTNGIFNLLMPRHDELWCNIPDPYLSGSLTTLNPTPSSDWTIQGVTTGWIEALSTDHYAAVITSASIAHRAVYFTCMLETMGQYNENNRQLFYNAILWAVPRITILINPSTGPIGTNVTVTGVRATANGSVEIYWDETFIGNTTADEYGNFTYLLTVPPSSAGLHKIKAVDVTTGETSSETFRVIFIILDPSSGPVGTKASVNGAGFAAESQTTITFNDMFIGYATTDDFGNFTFTFNIPLSSAEPQDVNALDAEGNYAFATFTVVDVTPLDIKMDVGAIYFTGEIAEFYAQTTFKGQAINATIASAVLYKPDGTSEYLTTQLVATGLYKIVYNILGNTTGTYTLVITANYITDTVQAYGTSFKCFLLSSALTYMNAHVTEIKDKIATVVIPDLGMIRLNLTAMNVTLQGIFLKVISINGTTATIQTTLGVMNGTITRIDNNTATIVTPIGNIEADISSLKGAQETWIIPQYAIIIIALIAAVSSTLTLFFVRRRKTIEVK